MDRLNQIEGINKQTTWFVLITQTIMMGWSILASIYHLGSNQAFILTIGGFIVYLGYGLITKNELFNKILLFGLIAGILELLADRYSVVTIGALVYPSGETMLLNSPAYMPFSWAVALTQLGYYSLLLIRWKGMNLATWVMMLSGGMYIPLYEHLAKGADWWYYRDVSMIFNAPYYIIICEALVSLTLPMAMYYVAIRKKWFALILGAIVGFWILVSAMLAYKIYP